MTRDAVRAYYAGFGEREWARLATSAEGAVEFAVNAHAITAYLPSGASARVLDIGGGPGRYSIMLAERGHRVVLADLSPELLDIARTRIGAAGVASGIEEIVEADVCNLGRWDDGSFDAVLAMGPFYHLIDPTERELAAAELARVLRPGGLVFVALMPRYAFLRRTLALADERRHLAQPEFVTRVLDEGVFLNDIPGRFTAGYGVRPDDVAPFFARHNFTKLALLASEGIAAGLEDTLAELSDDDPDAYAAALDAIIRTAGDPSILGMSSHLLFIGRRDR